MLGRDSQPRGGLMSLAARSRRNPKPRLRVVAIICAAVGAATALSPAAAADPLPPALAHPSTAHTAKARARKIRALVIKHAHSSILTALKRRLGSRLVVRSTRRSRARAAATRRYDLVIVDGDDLSPRRMARRSELGQFLAAGRWVLALDTRAAHHMRALSRHTGLTTLPRIGRRTERHRRPMFLFARGRVGHSQRTFIVDIRTLSPSGSGHLRPRQRRRARARAARGAARLLENALQVKPAQVIGQTAPQGDSGLPPEVQHVA